MNFTPIAGCVDCCLQFILLFAVFILIRDYFLMVYLNCYSFESKRRCASHIRCTSSRHHQYIFVQSYIFFDKKKYSFYGKIIKKTKFCANKYKKCIIYRKYTDIIQAEEKQKKKRTKTKTTSLDTLPWFCLFIDLIRLHAYFAPHKTDKLPLRLFSMDLSDVPFCSPYIYHSTI